MIDGILEMLKDKSRAELLIEFKRYYELAYEIRDLARGKETALDKMFIRLRGLNENPLFEPDDVLCVWVKPDNREIQVSTPDVIDYGRITFEVFESIGMVKLVSVYGNTSIPASCKREIPNPLTAGAEFGFDEFVEAIRTISLEY